MSLIPDRGLALRMAATLATVVATTALFVGVLVYLAAPWLGAVASTLGDSLGLPQIVTAGWWIPLVAALVAVCVWAQLRYVRRETLAAVDATPATEDSHPDLNRRVTRLAAQASTPVPECYVVDSETPNSFALDGVRQPTLVVSTGLLETLDGDHLDGVLAHEFAHLQHRDATVMTLASFLPALTSDRYSPLDSLGPWARNRVVWAFALVVAYLAGALLTRSNPAHPAYVVQFAVGSVAAVVVGGVALGVFATVAVVAARRLARYREFAADAGGARLTGDPAALADALARLDEETVSAPTVDKRLVYDEIRGLCLLPNGFDPDAEPSEDEFHVETRSHPPTGRRIERLRGFIDRQ